MDRYGLGFTLLSTLCLDEVIGNRVIRELKFVYCFGFNPVSEWGGGENDTVFKSAKTSVWETYNRSRVHLWLNCREHRV